MPEQNNRDDLLEEIYQPTHLYTPIPKGKPKIFIPPKGGTGSVEIKTINIKRNNKSKTGT